MLSVLWRALVSAAGSLLRTAVRMFSGRLPIKLLETPVLDLLRDFAQGRGNSSDYYDALNRLGSLKPDLWLPAQPWNGQNANLYGSEWNDLLAGNRKLLP